MNEFLSLSVLADGDFDRYKNLAKMENLRKVARSILAGFVGHTDDAWHKFSDHLHQIALRFMFGIIARF
jgi:hypothetical protein